MTMGILFSSKAQDLVVPVGVKHFASSSETFSNVTVNGYLFINPNVKLTVTNKLTVNSVGTLFLTKSADLKVTESLEIFGGTLRAVERADIQTKKLYTVGGKIIISSGTNIEVDQAFLNDDSEVSMNGDCVVRISNETQTLGPFLFSMSSTDNITFGGNVILEEIEKIDFRNGKLGFTGGKEQVFTAAKLDADNIEIYGQTLRLVTSDTVRLNKSLNLYSSKLISDRPIKIGSTEPTAVKRGSGYIIAPALTRSVDRSEIYTFPVGSVTRISGAQIYPLTGAEGKITVSVTDGSANNLSERPTEVTNVVTNFYHTIYKEGGVTEADIALFYPSEGQNSYNKIMTYNETLLKWGLLSSLSGSLTMSPNLNGASARKAVLSEYNGLNPGSNVFVLAKTVVQQPSNNKSYAVLTKKLDGGYVWTSDGFLRFQFEEEYPEDQDVLKWAVYSADNKRHEGVQVFPVAYGDNRYEIDVRSYVSFGFGVLEVSNNKNEKWYLKFKAGTGL